MYKYVNRDKHNDQETLILQKETQDWIWNFIDFISNFIYPNVRYACLWICGLWNGCQYNDNLWRIFIVYKCLTSQKIKPINNSIIFNITFSQ